MAGITNTPHEASGAKPSPSAPLTWQELVTMYAAAEPAAAVVKVTALERVRDALTSTASAYWGRGQEAGRGWRVLGQFSPPHRGCKRMVTVCEESLYRQAQREQLRS
jgi:hypothetical protein